MTEPTYTPYAGETGIVIELLNNASGQWHRLPGYVCREGMAVATLFALTYFPGFAFRTLPIYH